LFDLNQARVLTPQEQGDRLQGVRLLFLGEHHEDSRSHDTELELLQLLQSRGRLLTVALEMFPPDADAALDDWRQGRVEEVEFLERSRWYETWGYPWRLYRPLFLWFREQRIPLHGVNADDATRAAARSGRVQDLSPALQKEVGDLDAVIEPHRDLFLDELNAGGHGGDFAADSPQFKSFLRVQTLWDRLMGQRAAKLAEAQTGNGLVVLLIGSGHLAYGLGANLQAARSSSVSQLTMWDTTEPRADLDTQGRGHVPVGVADWARLYVLEAIAPGYPSLAGVKLAQAPAGVRVEGVSPFAAPWLQSLKAGDVIRTVNGILAGTPTRLRYTSELLGWNAPVELVVDRDGAPQVLKLTPAP
jgi:uncharacterized iron-regulated protein